MGREKKEKQLRAEGNNPALSSDGYSAFQEFWPEMQSHLSAGPKAVVSHWDRIALWDLPFLRVSTLVALTTAEEVPRDQ